MMKRPVRLVILILLLLLFIPLFRQGRGVPPKRVPAAFFNYSSGLVVVRVRGPEVLDRIYRINDGATLQTVIYMAVGEGGRQVSPQGVLARRMTNGDVVELVGKPGKRLDIKMKTMKARERMVLGIPLDPDRMDQADWEALPGIGPKLAERIVCDRQLNGDFGPIERLKRVRGIGDGVIARIKRYFLDR